MIEKEHFKALRVLYSYLEHSSINWVLTGSLGMALQTVDVEVHDIDIQTDRNGAYEIEKLLSKHIKTPVRYLKSERIRSHLGTFEVAGIKVEVMGDLQKLLENDIWEEPVVIERYKRWLEVEGMKIPVLSLGYEYEAYRKLERPEKIKILKRWLDATLKILPFQPADQAPAKALILDGLVDHWGVLDEDKNPDLDDIATTYADGIFLVAWQNNEIIGTGAFKPHSEKQVEIRRMSVKKELRRRGIGRQILDDLLRRAADAGYEEVILETTETWQNVIDFYLDYGFEITHHQAGNVWFRKALS